MFSRYLKNIMVAFFIFSHILLVAEDDFITITGTDTVAECRLTESAKSFSANKHDT